ncbi:MAG: flagellin [Candidatus Zixiibacteriota bacterium]|nr:MAG: flagellin [candidate division Zixibacteria bacterium]
MALTINTNVASLNAQRNLGKSQGALNKSMQRLSSGLRINSAKDDAAGLAISDRMTSQIRGLNQAARNANDGISLAQTAEGALQESTNLLQRMRELAVQSANDTNTSADRASLQAEISQNISELDRIANNTTFNNKQLLDGSMTSAVFHVGANANQTISMSIGDARADALGANAEVSSTGTTAPGTASGSLTNVTGVLTINNQVITTSSDNLSTTDDDNSAMAVAAGVNAFSATTGVTATANATTVNLGAVSADNDGIAASEFSINGVDITLADVQSADADDALADAINAVSNQTGVSAEMNSSNEMVLTAADGRNIQLEADGNGEALFASLDLTTAQDEVIVGSVSLSSNDAVVINTGTTSGSGMTFTAGTTSVTTTNSMTNVDISTQSGANDAISNIDRAIAQIDTSRGDLGAVQNRFESTIANLQNVSENLSAARSRILDADIAQETSAMTKNNILQQAGVSILAQANQMPQLALSLLG